MIPVLRDVVIVWRFSVTNAGKTRRIDIDVLVSSCALAFLAILSRSCYAISSLSIATTCGKCGQSFRKFSSFKTHIRREQSKKDLAERTDLEEEAVEEYDDNSSVVEHNSDEEHEGGDHIRDITKFLAPFILKTRRKLQIKYFLQNFHLVVRFFALCATNSALASLAQ